MKKGDIIKVKNPLDKIEGYFVGYFVAKYKNKLILADSEDVIRVFKENDFIEVVK